MNKTDKKFNEEALRKKIREQLQKEHSEKKEFLKESPEHKDLRDQEEDESYFLEIYLRNKLEDEVFSQYAEFVECGNHLDQVKWLTPLELSKEYEFFPIEYTLFARIKNKLFGRKKVKIPENPEIVKMIEEFRENLENNARERIQKYKEYLEKNEIAYRSEKEKRILEEEKERFYNSLKGYFKYKNHIGETTWLTVEEFEAQDEFTDRVYTRNEKIKIGFTSAGILAFIVVSLVFLVQFFDDGPWNGYILVETSNIKTSLYIDQNLAVGFTPGNAYPVSVGSHEITVISPNYVSNPLFHSVEIQKGDTTRISFDLTLINGNRGTVRLDVPSEDAGVYVDGEFKGTMQTSRVLNLPVGDHSVTVKKHNYIANPRLHTFSLNAGDTVDLSFRLIQSRVSETSKPRSSTLNLGLIEINSNIRDAKIILNGNNTGFTTNYILQKIPFGQHIIRLEKEGYKVYPSEQVVVLSQNDRQAKVDFTLTSTTNNVTIQTRPRDAAIFVDGKEVGKGVFRGALSFGEHTVTFSDIDNYKNPGPQKIRVTKDGQDRFEFTYGSEIYFEIAPGYIKPANSGVRTSSGYILKGINFKTNSINGPDIITNSFINKDVWNLGFAFQYKSPPGNDAIFIRFEVPNDLHLTNDILLRLWIYSTEEGISPGN